MSSSKKFFVFTLFIACTAVIVLSPKFGSGKSLGENGNMPPQTTLPQGDKPIFVEFYSNDCPTCMKMKPVIEKLVKEYDGKVEILILNTDDPKNNQLSEEFKVYGIPAFHWVSSKLVVKTSHEGEASFDAMKAEMESLIAYEKESGAEEAGTKSKSPQDG